MHTSQSHHPLRIIRRTLLGGAILGSLALFTGCAGQPRPGPGSIAGLQIEPYESRIDVILGRTLIIPLEVSPGTLPDTLTLHLDDRRPIEGQIHWITIAPDDSPSAWLPPAGQWSATPPSTPISSGSFSNGTSQARGWWVLAIDLPPDAINQGLWIGRTRLNLNWYLPAQSPQTGASPRPAAADDGNDPQVLSLASHEMLSPARRWRYRLLTEGLNPFLPAASSAISPFDDPILEALAQQYESRWTVALGLLAHADRQVADRLRQRLAAVAEFPDGRRAPVWPMDQGDLELLLTDLLNPQLDPPTRAGRATSWLDAQPPAAVWIIDDAGLREAATSATVSTVAIANLSPRDVLVSAAQAGAHMSPELRTIPAFAARTLAPAALLPFQDARERAAAPQPITFTVGRWSAVRAVVTDPVPITPPGLRIDSFHGDWTLAGWLTGAPEPAMRIPGAWSTSVLLHRVEADDVEAAVNGGSGGGSGGSGGTGRWLLHIECRVPASTSAELEGADEVFVHIGPYESPVSLIRITRDGAVTDLRAPRAASSASAPSIPGARVMQASDRWIAMVPLPEHAVDHTGELLLSLTRTDARSIRSAWPRPMLPWQTEPGRLMLDTRRWGAIAPAPEVER